MRHSIAGTALRRVQAGGQDGRPCPRIATMPATLRPLTLAWLALAGLVLAGLVLVLSACKPATPPQQATVPATASASTAGYAAAHAGDYAVVPFKADLSRFDAQGAFTRDPAHGRVGLGPPSPSSVKTKEAGSQRCRAPVNRTGLGHSQRKRSGPPPNPPYTIRSAKTDGSTNAANQSPASHSRV